ncbi:siphovirus Gp157 family protein [Microbulbifer sp. JMSA008]|uniref:siphovirus Gp157 family protein n=1 Tax=Microbulbifer sp. JMSA008 TaxID=3243373 RepID=UPI0040399321
MTALKLYEITDQARELKQLAEDNDMTPEDIADTLEGIELEFNEKAIQIGNLLMNFTPFEKGLDDEIKRLQAKKKALQNRRDSITEYLRFNMQECGIKKIECPVFTISLKKPMAKVDIENEDALPGEFVTVKNTFTPDKKALLAALKEGQEIPGARLAEAKPALQIR